MEGLVAQPPMEEHTEASLAADQHATMMEYTDYVDPKYAEKLLADALDPMPRPAPPIPPPVMAEWRR